MQLPEALSSGTCLGPVSVALGAAFSLLLSGGPAAAEATDLARVLAKIREAVGYTAMQQQLGGVLVEGDAQYSTVGNLPVHPTAIRQNELGGYCFNQ